MSPCRVCSALRVLLRCCIRRSTLPLVADSIGRRMAFPLARQQRATHCVIVALIGVAIAIAIAAATRIFESREFALLLLDRMHAFAMVYTHLASSPSSPSVTVGSRLGSGLTRVPALIVLSQL